MVGYVLRVADHTSHDGRYWNLPAMRAVAMAKNGHFYSSC